MTLTPSEAAADSARTSRPIRPSTSRRGMWQAQRNSVGPAARDNRTRRSLTSSSGMPAVSGSISASPIRPTRRASALSPSRRVAPPHRPSTISRNASWTTWRPANAALAAVPACSAVTRTWLVANGANAGQYETPASCTALAAECPDFLVRCNPRSGARCRREGARGAAPPPGWSRRASRSRSARRAAPRRGVRRRPRSGSPRRQSRCTSRRQKSASLAKPSVPTSVSRKYAPPIGSGCEARAAQHAAPAGRGGARSRRAAARSSRCRRRPAARRPAPPGTAPNS